MKVQGTAYRSIWLHEDGWRVSIIDQTHLPFAFEILHLTTVEDAVKAIRDMQVRGAPLIGATAAYGVCLALRQNASDSTLQQAFDDLVQTRPTAVNLRWALQHMTSALQQLPPVERVAASYQLAAELCDEDACNNERIGDHGLKIIRQLWEQSGQSRPIKILTHCNAGWLATVDWGTALAPIYKAHDAGISLHIWVDETRPRNQGASLTAWELQQHGVPHHVICDNAGGHLMQHGEVDLCIVGSDRTTARGDVCNKIGTYLKALAAKDNGVPFYVALPCSTIDWEIENGIADIPIEQRDTAEVSHLTGLTESGDIQTVQITTPGSKCANPAFDVTPAHLVSGLITEHGVCNASKQGLNELFGNSPE